MIVLPATRVRAIYIHIPEGVHQCSFWTGDLACYLNWDQTLKRVERTAGDVDDAHPLIQPFLLAKKYI